MVVDGVRMNNAIFRSGNLQNIINIDANALESSEVIFGPGSVIYGSDALGGVMDLHTIDPRCSTDGQTHFTANALTRYSTAANERTGHLDFAVTKSKFTLFHSSSFTAFDDLKAGSNRAGGYEGAFLRTFYAGRVNDQDQLILNDDPDIQKFSGYNLFNTITKAKYRLSDNVDIQYGFYYSTTSDIPRYDNLTETISNESDSLLAAEWYYGPQKWSMHNLRINYYGDHTFFDQARLTMAYQNFEESRNDRGFGADRLRTRIETVDMYSASLDFDKELTRAHLYYGVDYYFNDVASSGFRKNIETGQITSADSRYPDGGSSFGSLAFYGSYVNNLTDQITFNSGLRYNYINLKATTLDSTALSNSAAKLDLKNDALNGSLGLAIKLNEMNKISYNVSSGFRAPNVDDVGKLFEVGNRLVVPNAELKPEYTLSSELAYQRKTERALLNIVTFYSRLFDAIVDGPYSLNGMDSIVVEGRNRAIFAKVNSDNAEIYGASLLFQFEIAKNWAISNTINYTGGRDLTNDEPLRHTTPLFGKTMITYQQKKWRSQFYVEFNGNRDRADIPESEILGKPYLYTATGTPGWYTLNLKTSYQVNELINLNAGVENILDKHYRPYSSGISAPGRNFILALRARI